MNEVKRYDFDMLNCDEPSIGEFREHTEGDYTKYDDFQSERAARIAAETKLAELEDAVISLPVTHVPIGSRLSDQMIALRNTIFEERKARSKS